MSNMAQNDYSKMAQQLIAEQAAGVQNAKPAKNDGSGATHVGTGNTGADMFVGAQSDGDYAAASIEMINEIGAENVIMDDTGQLLNKVFRGNMDADDLADWQHASPEERMELIDTMMEYASIGVENLANATLGERQGPGSSKKVGDKGK